MSLSALLDNAVPSNTDTVSENTFRKPETWIRVAFLAALYVVYIQLFFILFRNEGVGIGVGVGAMTVVPVIAGAVMFGIRGGVAAWAVGTVINTILLNLLAPSDETGLFGWDAIIIYRGAGGTLVLLVVALVVGRLHDLSEQLKQELERRRRAEASVEAARAVLEKRVEERTADLQAATIRLNELLAERDRMVLELRELLENEQHLNEVKSRIGAFLSHEFRNPLAMIQSSNDLLKNYSERLSPRRKEELLVIINKQVIHLNELLGDMLTVSKIERRGLNSLDYNPQSMDADALCREVVEELQHLNEETHSIHYTLTGEVRAATMDRKLIRRVIVNLLTNAIKYSPQGGSINFELRNEIDCNVLRVSDQGIGIPPSDLKHLFETFNRGSNVSGIPGTGLGLALTRHAITAHGGTVEVESSLGVGTTFTVRIPLEAPVKSNE